MEEGFVKVASFVALIVVGYLFRRFALLTEEAFRVLSCIVLYITLPCLILRSLNGVTIEPGMLWVILLGLFGNFLMIAVGWRMNKGRGREVQAFSMLGLSGYNIGLFAIPFVYSFLTPEAFLAVCLFDAGNALMCTGGTFALVKIFLDPTHSFSFLEFFKRLFSSLSLIVYIIMIPLALLHFSFPEPVIIFTKAAADANAFLCMIMIGVNTRLHMSPENFRILTRSILARYGWAIVFALAMYFLLPFPEEIRQAVALMAFAPMSAISLIFILRINGDVFTAGNINSVSILLSTALMSFLLMML